MADDKLESRIMKLTELVKRITEQKSREATALEAVRRARKIIQERGEFIPKRIKPAHTVQIRL